MEDGCRGIGDQQYRNVDKVSITGSVSISDSSRKKNEGERWD